MPGTEGGGVYGFHDSGVESAKFELHDEHDDYEDDYEEEDLESQLANMALLSNVAIRVRDKVPRGSHVKGGIPYPHAFTGKDIVVSKLPSFLPCETQEFF